MSRINYKSERFKDCLAEMKMIFNDHWEELALDKDKVPLQPNYDEYFKLCDAGRLITITARDNGVLIGYYIGFIGLSLHYQSCLECTMDIFYIKPEYRNNGIGKGLFTYTEFILKKMRIHRWIVGSKLHKDSAFLFECFGFKPIEMYYSKYIGD